MKLHLINQPFIRQTGSCILVPAMLLVCTAALAQSPQSEKAGADNGKSEIADYMRSKYKVRYLDSQIKKTVHGPAGSIYIIGDITPKDIGAAMAVTNKADRARGIAKPFILGEPEIFGAIGPHELKETALETDPRGVTHIRYRRTISGILFEDTDIVVHIGPDERISSMSARVAPIPPALHWEVTRPTIGEDALLPIIEADLKASNTKYTVLKMLGNRKVATAEPPYIIWVSDISLYDNIGSWNYRIDAFTGMIVKKTNNLIIE